MKDRLILFSVLLVFISFGFAGCTKKVVRTDVGVELAEKKGRPAEEKKPVEEEKPAAEKPEVKAPETAGGVAPAAPAQEAGPAPETVEAATPTAQPAPEQPPVEAAAELRDVYFDYDRYAIRDDAVDALKANAELIMNNPQMRVTIEGHCDERGTVEYNIALGERRAMAVKKYLTDLGVEPGRLSIISYGKERPFCLEHNEQCWQLNRRAHFVIR